MSEVDLETAEFLAVFTEVGLGTSEVAEHWRTLVTTMPYPHLRSKLRDQWWAEGRAQGLAEGRAEEAAAAVLRVLRGRGLAVPPAVEARVRECRDLEVLERLHTRAILVERAEDLFTS
jgi:hypothetical protein